MAASGSDGWIHAYTGYEVFYMKVHHCIPPWRLRGWFTGTIHGMKVHREK